MNTTNVYKKILEQVEQSKKIIVNEGGTRSSKTYSILAFLITLLYNPEIKNITISVVSESLPHLKRGAMKDFFDILKADNLYKILDHNHTDHKYKVGTNTIEFIGMDEPDKATGAGRTILFVNECNHIPYALYKQLQMRTTFLTLLDYNPETKFWVHTDILNLPYTGYIHSTYLDNPYVSQNTIDLLETAKLNDNNYYRVYALGLIGNLEGLIYTNWDITQWDETVINKIKKIYSLDFGFSNDPSCLISLQTDELNKQIYIDEFLYQTDLTNYDLINLFKQNNITKRDLIVADSAEPKSIEEIRRMGYNIIKSVKGPDSVNNGIQLLKQYHMNISPRSLNIIKELRGYQWIKNQNGEYINKPSGADHSLDTIRYGIMATKTQVPTFHIAGKLKL